VTASRRRTSRSSIWGWNRTSSPAGRVELLLDVLEAVPETTLDVVGEGNHRPQLEAKIRRRGLESRVCMHGYVDDETRARLYGRAWVNVTASQSEGWSLTVMEAALCGTPSAALAVGGLPESIVDGETGLLATNTEGLARSVRNILERPELRERLGDAAWRRARGFTWDRSATAFLDVLHRAAGRELPEPPPSVVGSDGSSPATAPVHAAESGPRA
jgi:glycosyltransferase involved in cell wall biosynthesis